MQEGKDILKLLVTRIKKNNLLEKYYLVMPEELADLLVSLLKIEIKEYKD